MNLMCMDEFGQQTDRSYPLILDKTYLLPDGEIASYMRQVMKPDDAKKKINRTLNHVHSFLILPKITQGAARVLRESLVSKAQIFILGWMLTFNIILLYLYSEVKSVNSIKPSKINWEEISIFNCLNSKTHFAFD